MRRWLILTACAALLAPVPTTQAARFLPCSHPTIDGTPQNDFLIGTAGRDVIRGRRGNDHILGLDGSDIMCGGGGNDHIDGDGSPSDFAYGGNGNDRCDAENEQSC